VPFKHRVAGSNPARLTRIDGKMSSNSIAIVSEAEYLATSYEPDAEFEDGVLIERNVGERDHSWLQAALAAYFFQRRRLWAPMTAFFVSKAARLKSR
jgi:hypothetical protein